MSCHIYFDEPTTDDNRRFRLYEGAIFVYRPTQSSDELCRFARAMCEEYFHPHHPPDAQHRLSVDEYIDILKRLKPTFIHHPECKRLIAKLLTELDCDPQQTYFDVPRLRTACAGDYLSSGLAYAFKPHRDTWYSPPMCQLNWWLPVYETNPENVMAFHPNYWSQPVNNSSREFNYQDWNQNGRKQATTQGKKDERRQSEALEPLELANDVRLICPPGSVIIFSAAQLHSTVQNVSSQTRFSIDFRTVHAAEIASDGGAANIDCECTGTTLMDYIRMSDLSHFPSEIVTEFQKKKLQPRFPSQY